MMNRGFLSTCGIRTPQPTSGVWARYPAGTRGRSWRPSRRTGAENSAAGIVKGASTQVAPRFFRTVGRKIHNSVRGVSWLRAKGRFTCPAGLPNRVGVPGLPDGGRTGPSKVGFAGEAPVGGRERDAIEK